MIVVAIIGILAAVAIPAFMDYIKRSKKTEAALQLNKLGKNAKRVYSETSQYVADTVAGHTPTTPDKPAAGGCCGGNGTSGNNPNHCASDPTIWKSGAWPVLDFEIDEDTLFYYDYRGTATDYRAMATGDLDCDGTEITFILDGAAVNGQPTYTLTEPPANAD